MITTDSLDAQMRKNRKLLSGFSSDHEEAKRLIRENERMGEALGAMKRLGILAVLDSGDLFKKTGVKI